MGGGCCIILFISLYGNLFWSDGKKIIFNSGEKTLINSMGNDLYELAHKFENVTKRDTEFLADPDDTVGSGWFQVVAERNCYVIQKVIPSSKCMMDDWYQRYVSTKDFESRSATEIEQIMKLSNIKYILVKNSNYKKFDESDTFKVFLT